MDSQAGRGWAARLAGVRTRWRTVEDGEFFCPDCGGDRNYRRRTGRRRFVLLGVPVLPRGAAAPVIECAACRGHFDAGSLDGPTTQRLATMLRDAVHSVALSVLAAGGTEAPGSRAAAVEMVRAAGFPDCTEDQLLTLLAALRADTGTEGADGLVPAELSGALRALAPHLAPAGRESLLLQGASVALADGPYRPVEREVLEAVGQALAIQPEDTERLLAAARTPS